MWSPERSAGCRRLIRVGMAIALAALVAGCFQPLYGDRSVTGGPALTTALAGVDIAQIDAVPGSPESRLAVEVRNELTYAMNNGGRSLPPTHRLDIKLNTGNSSIIVDRTTARAEYEVVALEATYTLVDLRTQKPVFSGSASARTSYDVPGQQQRFQMLRARRDSQSRAGQVIAEQIRNRLASYFAAGS